MKADGFTVEWVECVYYLMKACSRDYKNKEFYYLFLYPTALPAQSILPQLKKMDGRDFLFDKNELGLMAKFPFHKNVWRAVRMIDSIFAYS